MMKIILALALVLPATAVMADQTIYHCQGILISNGTCIGSESNVNSFGDHEPIYGDSYYTKPEPRQDRRPEPEDRNREPDDQDSR